MAELYLKNLYSVRDKIVLVTGAGSGIGNMIANAFATNGAKVYIVGRRKEPLDAAVQRFESLKLEDAGKLVALQGDVSSKESIEKLIEDFRKHDKMLHVLVNNAGIVRRDKIVPHPDDTEKILEGLWSSDWKGWEETQTTNVTALYFMAVGFAPLMREAFKSTPNTEEEPRETPCVINISSIGGIHNGRQSSPVNYMAAKNSVHFLTKLLATRFTPIRIRVNCIAPEMTASSPAELHKSHAGRWKEMPEKRAGAPPDIAGPAIMLASRGGAYLNGITIDCGGGRTLMLAGIATTPLGETAKIE